MARTPSTTSRTHGTPLISTKVPRLVLHSQTVATPAATTAAILRALTLGGGATSPEFRRRASRTHVQVLNTPATTTMRLQLVIGVRLPLAMLLMTGSLIGTTP